MAPPQEPPRKGRGRLGPKAGQPFARGTQGNFDHLMGLISNLADAHNLTVSDVEAISHLLGVELDGSGPSGSGSAGADGATGATGAAGGAGASGPPGPPGADGETGDPGAPGAAGAAGGAGPAGPAGAAGADGDPGPSGPPGAIGADGESWEAGAVEDNTLAVHRGTGGMLSEVWNLETDPETELSFIPAGDAIFSVSFQEGTEGGAGHDAVGETGWINGSLADPDYWDTTHEAGTTLHLEEGVYVYSAWAGMGTGTEHDDDTATAFWDYAEDPSAISAFANFSSGLSNQVSLTTRAATDDGGWEFTGLLVVPTGGADYVFSIYTDFTAGDQVLHRFDMVISKAQGAGATGTTGLSTQVFEFNTTDPPVDGDQEPSYYAPYNMTITDVAASGIARSSAITIDIEKNGTSIYPAATKPTAPSAGGIGTRRVPDTTSVTQNDKLTVNLTDSNGTGRIVVYIRYTTP